MAQSDFNRKYCQLKFELESVFRKNIFELFVKKNVLDIIEGVSLDNQIRDEGFFKSQGNQKNALKQSIQ